MILAVLFRCPAYRYRGAGHPLYQFIRCPVVTVLQDTCDNRLFSLHYHFYLVEKQLSCPVCPVLSKQLSCFGLTTGHQKNSSAGNSNPFAFISFTSALPFLVIS